MLVHQSDLDIVHTNYTRAYRSSLILRNFEGLRVGARI